MKPKSLRHLRRNQKRFLKLRHEQDLAELLEIPLYRLKLIGLKPRYHLFGIPKKDGSQRWIENPAPELKGCNSFCRSIGMLGDSIYRLYPKLISKNEGFGQAIRM